MLHDFSVTIPKCYKDIYINSVLPRKAMLYYLPTKCFPLNFDLNDFNSRVDKHILSLSTLYFSKNLAFILFIVSTRFSFNSV